MHPLADPVRHLIDGLAREIKAAKTVPTIEKLRINILLFADDLVLIADSRKELQYLLDLAYSYSEKWRFRFNVTKSKLVVFKGRKKGQDSGAIFLGLQELERVEIINILGLILKATCRGNPRKTDLQRRLERGSQL